MTLTDPLFESLRDLAGSLACASEALYGVLSALTEDGPDPPVEAAPSPPRAPAPPIELIRHATPVASTLSSAIPPGLADACAWKPGRANVHGELVPLEEPDKEHLRAMARHRGARGMVWLNAIERAETRTDGKDLSVRLKEIPVEEQGALIDAAEPVAPIGAGRNGA
jgi:hypothetical protein